jgi:hypothetical protein
MSIANASRLFLPILVAAATAACGGGGAGVPPPPPPAPPSIANLALNQTSVAQGSGTISIPGSLQFTDPGGNLASFAVTVLDAGGHQVSASTTQLQGTSGKTSGILDGTVQLVVGAPAVFTIQVYVTDADGAKSNTLSTQFQVVAAASMAAVVTATGPSPSSLTVSNGTLYWLESGEDALKSVGVGGGTAQVVATRMVNPTSMAFSGSDVIWSDYRRSGGGSCPGATPDQVLKRTSASGVTTVVASGGACGVGTANIAVIGTTLYWTSSDSSQETLNATPLGGGTTTTVANSMVPIRQIVASGGTLYWLEFGPAGDSMSAIRSVPGGGGPIGTVLSGFNAGVGTFAVDTTNVYYTIPAGPNAVGLVDLVAMPLAGGAATTLASAISPPFKVISAGARIVWIDGVQQVWSIAVGGGSPLSLATVSPGGGGPYDLAFDGTNVVWTEASSVGTPAQAGAVRAVPPTGGTVTTLYQSSDLPQQLAIDPASRVNWIESNGQGLARIARLGAGNAPQTVADGISSSPSTFVVAGGALIVPDLYRLKSISLSGGLPSTLVVDTWPIANLATDGTSLVWNDARNGTLRKAPVVGGVVTVLADTAALGAFIGTPGSIRIGPNGGAYWVVSVSAAPGQPGTPNVVSAPVAAPTMSVTATAPNLPDATDLAVDATGVYIAEALGVGPSIVRAPLSGAGTLTTVNSNPVGPRMLTLDGPTLYWVDGLEIAKIPAAGGAPFGVLDFDSGAVAGSVAIDSTSVYFTEPTLQDIRRTPK